MQHHETHRETTPSPFEPAAGPGRPEADTFGAILADLILSHPRYERAALANAIDDGLMPDEVVGILAGRRVAEAFPVRWGESPEAYASRAVSQMFVSYLQ